ncbi:MAG: hypothetical protein KIT84_36850 [Labilithrix sp.]|nr:hypothetical protein [Labilithrix sp.]MCW5816626.1 hypothetical protein [Labilithrix sp.]
MRFSTARNLAFGALVAAATWATPAFADDIDRPTLVRDKPLDGTSETTGATSKTVGFPYHVYTAKTDGFVRIQMETTNVNPRDNGGKAWRPYLRVISHSNEDRHGEAWSTNGQQNDRSTGRAQLVLRVKAGEKFTVIASMAQNFVVKRPDAVANYKLIVTEVAQ